MTISRTNLQVKIQNRLKRCFGSPASDAKLLKYGHHLSIEFKVTYDSAVRLELHIDMRELGIPIRQARLFNLALKKVIRILM